VWLYVVGRRQWPEACSLWIANTSTRSVLMTKAWRSGVERIWRYHSEYACICIVFSPSSFLSDPRQAYASDFQERWVRWCYCWSVLVLIRSHLLLITVINDRFERFRMTIDGNNANASTACSRQSMLLPVIIDYVGWKQKKN